MNGTEQQGLNYRQRLQVVMMMIAAVVTGALGLYALLHDVAKRAGESAGRDAAIGAARGWLTGPDAGELLRASGAVAYEGKEWDVHPPEIDPLKVAGRTVSIRKTFVFEHEFAEVPQVVVAFNSLNSHGSIQSLALTVQPVEVTAKALTLEITTGIPLDQVSVRWLAVGRGSASARR